MSATQAIVEDVLSLCGCMYEPIIPHYDLALYPGYFASFCIMPILI